ncbi:MAG: glycerol-3-phosphate 1-O-acyltransferase PlsY [Clostridia bacterium]|nr:glycerol-3-phosphate 1-O-acyltransferase PlsY [Clostridia bacterium]
MMTAILSIITLAIGYLIGSIMSAVKIAKARSRDIRECGSGNAGSTNVLRTFGWKWGLLCLFFDSLKGAVSVFIGMGVGYAALRLFPNAKFISDLSLFLGCVGLLGAVLGHLLPLFYQFRGGKCVAVALGGFLVLSPVQLLIALAVAIVLIAITRMVSVGSVVGTLTVATLVIIKNWLNIPLTAVSVIVAAIIVIAHLPNIQRIMAGRERRLDRIEWEKREEAKREDGSKPADSENEN